MSIKDWYRSDPANAGDIIVTALMFLACFVVIALTYGRALVYG